MYVLTYRKQFTPATDVDVFACSVCTFCGGLSTLPCRITHTIFMAIMYLNTFMHNGPFMRGAHLFPYMNFLTQRNLKGLFMFETVYDSTYQG